MTFSRSTGLPALLSTAVLLSGCAGMGVRDAAIESTTATPEGSGDGEGLVNITGFPLRGPQFQASALRQVSPGDRFGHGTLVVFNAGDDPLRLEKVTPVDVGPGLRFIGASVAGLDRKYSFYQQTPWPLNDEFGNAVPAEGAVIEPTPMRPTDLGFQIVLAYELLEEGRTTVRGVEVTYSDLGSGEKTTVTFGETLAVCSGLPLKEECEVEEENAS